MAAAELVAETEPETEGACGWSKHQVSVELMGGGQADVSIFFIISSSEILVCLCYKSPVCLPVGLSADSVRGGSSTLVSSPGLC